MVGAVIRALAGARSKAGALSMAGTITRRIQISRSVYGAFCPATGEVPEAYKEALYFGVPNP